MTSTRQKSILRGSEIFGYDEKEYPERMLQRAAGWCKAVQGVRGKRPSKRERQASVITGRALLDAH